MSAHSSGALPRVPPLRLSGQRRRVDDEATEREIDEDTQRRNISFYGMQRQQSVYDERTLKQLASPLSARGSNDRDAQQRRRLRAVTVGNVRRAVAAGVAAAGLERAWVPVVCELASHAVELLDADSISLP